jgi:hypothetical protein
VKPVDQQQRLNGVLRDQRDDLLEDKRLAIGYDNRSDDQETRPEYDDKRIRFTIVENQTVYESDVRAQF